MKKEDNKGFNDKQEDIDKGVAEKRRQNRSWTKKQFR